MWSRWKITKIRSKYSGAIPIPLSCTENSQNPSVRRAPTCTRGGSSGRRYLIAFPTRFEKTCASCVGSPSTAGSGSCVTIVPVSRITRSSPATASANAASASTGADAAGVAVTRE